MNVGLPLKKPKASVSQAIPEDFKSTPPAPILKVQPVPVAKPAAVRAPVAKSKLPKPLNPQIPRKPARMPTQDIPLEIQWKVLQETNGLAFYRTAKGEVRLWAPKVHWTKLKAHYKQFVPMAPDVQFTHRDEYWCPHCGGVKQFKWLACTDDLRCPGCGVPNYDKAVVKANYGEE